MPLRRKNRITPQDIADVSVSVDQEAITQATKPTNPQADDINFDEDMPIDSDTLNQGNSGPTPDETTITPDETTPKPVNSDEIEPKPAINQPETTIKMVENPDYELPTDFIVRNKTEEMLLIKQKVKEVITLYNNNELPHSSVEALKNAIALDEEEDFDESYDTRGELKTLLKMVGAARRHILDSDTQEVKATATVQDVKAVLDVSMKLAELLNKTNKDLINMERLQSIEASFTETINGLPQEQKIEYYSVLERRLKMKDVLKKNKVA